MNTELSGTPTHYEALTHIRFSERLHLLHIRYWSRVRLTLTLLLLTSGTAAFSTMFTQQTFDGMSNLGAWSGFVVAVLSIVNHTLSPADKQAAHRSAYRAYKTLHGEAFDCSALDLHKKIRAIERDECYEFDALSLVAFNDTMRTYGHVDMVEKETSFMHWLMRKLA